MAFDINVTPDGTVQRVWHTSKAVQALPTYGQWLKFLLERGHASVQGQTENGYANVRTLDQAAPHILTDGRTGIPCILCGLTSCPLCGLPGMVEAEPCCSGVSHALTPQERAEARSLLHHQVSPMARSAINLSLRHITSGLDRLIIGTTVRMRETEPVSDVPGINEDVREKPKPVSRAGLACKACQGLGLEAKALMARENREREAYNMAIAHMISEDEDTVYQAALAVSTVEIAMSILKAHQKQVAKELGTRGATKSLLTHAVVNVQERVLDLAKGQAQ
mgnify:CR=1 FL=1